MIVSLSLFVSHMLPCANEMTAYFHDAMIGFELPDPAGKAGGACTSAILDVLYSRGHDLGKNMSWVDALKDMQEMLKKMGYDQVPQLSSSRWYVTCCVWDYVVYIIAVCCRFS